MKDMRTSYIISCIALLLAAEHAVAQRTDTLGVLERVELHDSRMTDIGKSVYDNPALKQFMQAYSYTAVSMGYTGEKTTEAVCGMYGKGCDAMSFNVGSYIKHNSSTLWGEGEYTAGKRRSPVWNEVADAELVYPYITADAVGGDMDNETYRFSGGVSSYNGRLAWGAMLGYTAGHHYRDVDPRPRNITGRLDMSAGVAYRIAGRYVIAFGGDFMKYKQTGDIDFMSELGQTTVYHLTGLGTDYVRFRGNGFTTHYDGEQYGVQVNITPEKGNGMLATLHLQRMTLETILDDMNKLPLNGIRHDALKAEMGYRHGGNTSWGVVAGCELYRRHGTENIFGDAASSVYPCIGAVEMYADNACKLSLTGLVEHRSGRVMLSYKPLFGYSRRCQVYAYPAREWLVNNWNTEHSLRIYGKPGRRWHGMVEVSWALYSPLSSHLDMESDEGGESGLHDTVRSDFRYASSALHSYSAKCNIRYAVNGNSALQLSFCYRHDSYAASAKGNVLGISGGVVF